MYDAFSSDVADFSSLRKERNLYISSVIHKTYLKIFEDGCEAAAVTVVQGAWGGGFFPFDEIIYEMKVNRPFLFLLKNNKLPTGLCQKLKN
jgi:serpin B